MPSVVQTASELLSNDRDESARNYFVSTLLNEKLFAIKPTYRRVRVISFLGLSRPSEGPDVRGKKIQQGRLFVMFVYDCSEIKEI